ncbi:flagellar type III secretion system pore protein FliP [Marivita sp. GX14005]|uniref:flagellar type III secretion system pore protein FliP n=1 Tax=Marivita sp. GX14005 TaxID=2942276 RepID=UPI0020195BE0|nr:flagellar type III secretion system pore protein FliP [Marivita sp. GX14005]MCL3881839.1 flagellar type III secretion system pore protein FliP [Marivita sp. GX14005]
MKVFLATLGSAVIVSAPATAQSISLDFGDGGSVTGTTIQLIALITVLSIAPGIVITVTCFPFIITVLSILRQSIGLQQSPPNMLIVSIALFLTFFVMEPVLLEAWSQGVQPLLDDEIGTEEGFRRGFEPFREFMAAQVDPDTFATMARIRSDVELVEPGPETPLSILISTFLLSELARAFQVGFMIFVPFLIIDLVVAAVLMSMGMMMVPPAIVSLPFKLAFFVVANGWSLVAESLVRSYQ